MLTLLKGFHRGQMNAYFFNRVYDIAGFFLQQTELQEYVLLILMKCGGITDIQLELYGAHLHWLLCP